MLLIASVARWVLSKVHELSKKSSCFGKISSCIKKIFKQLKLLTIIIDFSEFYFKLTLLKLMLLKLINFNSRSSEF